MAYRTRINPKTGKEEYKVRYYFWVGGIKRDSETGWFDSLEKAEKEANNLKTKKEREDQLKIQNNTNKYLENAFYEHVESLKEVYEKDRTLTSKSYYEIARTIYRRHIPEEIKKVKIKDIDNTVFRTWVTIINKTCRSGGTVHNYKKGVLRFNDWLSDNNYYSNDYIRDNIYASVQRLKLKAVGTFNRIDTGNRNIITFSDLEKIGRYYQEKDIGKFRNFYYYTMFYVLFFSGLRPEELTGLQWKNVNLKKNVKMLYVYNSISRMEDKEYVYERLENGIDKVKTRTSTRSITIFDIYYQTLVDYKESYMYHYGCSKEYIEEGFVFPNITQNDIKQYMNGDTALKELKQVIKKTGIPNTDLQMFRHSCATYMILPKPKGLGYTEEQVMNFFGHANTDMLREIYAKISYVEKGEQMQRLFYGDIYFPEDGEKSEEEKKLEEMQRRMHGENAGKQSRARKYRIFAQIEENIEKGKTEYYYKKYDKEIIDEYIEEIGSKIRFIEEE